MDYYCGNGDIFIKPRSKKKHFISKTHKEFGKGKHKKLTIGNPNIKIVDKIFHAYISEITENSDYYLVKRDLKLVFKDCECCP